MTAPRITAEEIEYLRGFVAIPRAMSRETIRALDDVLDALDSAYAELDRLHADGMPRDREELQKLLNDAHRKGNQEAHEAHRLTQEMGLSAQGGEVPPPGFEVSVYAAIHHPGMLHGLPKICKRGPGAWAAFVDDTSCIGKDGQVHYEPRPSNRTQEFIALTRFDTPYEAADALRAQPTNETRG